MGVARDSSLHPCHLQVLGVPCGTPYILLHRKSLDIPPHRICVLKLVMSVPILGRYAPQSSRVAAKGYPGCMCEWIGSFCYCELSRFLPVGASFCHWTLLRMGQDIFALNLGVCTGYLPSACVESLELVFQWGDKKNLVHKLELVLLVR